MVRLTAAEAWAFWRDSLSQPKYILAPMVNASELQYRLLCKRYGIDLTYTPMLHSRLLYEDKDYRRKLHPLLDGELPMHYKSNSERYQNPKTIAQVCGSDPDTVVKGCQIIEDSVVAVDLNCGCPQGIAKRGNYGSYLLEKPDVILRVVEALVKHLKVPVTVKIRIVDDIESAEPTPFDLFEQVGGLASYNEDLAQSCPKTLKLIADLEELGVAAICVHGRTPKNKGHTSRAAEWGLIKAIVAQAKIPIIANGSIRTKADADKCMDYTGAAAVMSAIALLGNAALFMSSKPQAVAPPSLPELMLELCYLYDNVKVVGPVYTAPLKGHVFQACHSLLTKHTEIRQKLNDAKSVDEIRAICQKLAAYDPVPFSLNSDYYFQHLSRTRQREANQEVPGTPPSKKSRLNTDEEDKENDFQAAAREVGTTVQ